eukprot:NODE_2011_length_520_cov_435.658174_g1641_i0.p1 GENE.NODE_2011_length_520_cov_435.658174_g1641_i0~~NODE_2011_length_520_cov_435.658174_g1641_i0.p1  ORF type:complete len:125 (-),score=15.21 NODE_2011_length_520_cov_435.658174_g1641_i0:116-490(-)
MGGEEVYYGHNRSSSTGAGVSKDFTQGYGPECYVCVNPPQGEYVVEVNYFASHQDSLATGGTSTVIWRVKNMGGDDEDFAFGTQRLTAGKQRHEVLRFNVDQGPEAADKAPKPKKAKDKRCVCS